MGTGNWHRRPFSGRLNSATVIVSPIFASRTSVHRVLEPVLDAFFQLRLCHYDRRDGSHPFTRRLLRGGRAWSRNPFPSHEWFELLRCACGRSGRNLLRLGAARLFPIDAALFTESGGQPAGSANTRHRATTADGAAIIPLLPGQLARLPRPCTLRRAGGAAALRPSDIACFTATAPRFRAGVSASDLVGAALDAVFFFTN